MKRVSKLFAAAIVMASLFTVNAATKKDKAAEKPAVEEAEKAEKPKKEKKEKKAKKEKPAKEKSAKEKPAKPAKEAKAASPKKMKFDDEKYAASFAAGDYGACTAMLLGKGDRKNEIRDLLDADMLMYHAQNYLASGKGFLETYGKMQQATSAFNASDEVKNAKSNGNNRKYTGAEYERYLAWSMRLACALSLKQDDVAKGIMNDYTGTFMQEIQELRAKNEQFEAESEAALSSEEFTDAKEKLSTSGVDLSFVEPPKKSDKKYETSKFFNYLGTLAYAAYGDFDHAQDFANLYKVPDAKQITNIPAGKGRLELVALSGMIGKRADVSEGKEAHAVMLPIPVLNRTIPLYTKIAYPIFNPNDQKHNIKSVRAILSNGESATATLVEDFDEAVKIDVEQKAYGDYNRSVFRNVVKNSVVAASVIAAGIALNQASGKNALAALAAQIVFDNAVNAAANAVANKERADIRQGLCFPNKASRAGFTVAPGTYNVTVEYLDAAGKAVETKTIENVEVNAGQVSVRVSSCEK